MSNFENGIAGYVKGTAVITVYFPVDNRGNAHICCKQCPYFRVSSSSCALNGDMCAFPEHFVGQNCPLDRDGEFTNTNTNTNNIE